MIRLTNILAVCAALLLLLSACGSTALDLSEKLTVVMYGVYEAPVDATGNVEPRQQHYTLTDVSLINTDGSATSIFVESEPKDLVIINRAQIIEEAPLADYAETSFAGFRVSFASAISGSGKYEAEMPATLSSATADLLEPVTVTKAKVYRLNVKVQWKNTVTRDEDAKTEEMSAPTFALGLGDD
jgi:hypothetical protein